MSAARNASDCVKSITSIDTSLAGTTRSGAHRFLPGPDRETAASSESDSRAAHSADWQVVGPGGERLAPDHQAVDSNQLFEDSERETMAAANAAGEGGDVC